MGLETALIAAAVAGGAASLAGGFISANQAKKQGAREARAAVEQGDLVARNESIKTIARAAQQKTSFLNAGVYLEGTPAGVLASTFNTGLEDVNRIQSNAQTMARNSVAAARSKAISSIISGVTGAAASAGAAFGTSALMGGGAAGGAGGGASVFGAPTTSPILP